MANRLITPSLADIRQDIVGAIPVDIVKKWNDSKRTNKDHKNILAPFTKQGTVVASDSAGLSKLTQAKSLLEVLQLVSQPKEVIYTYAKAIGGQAVGVWAADNTQLFFDASVSPSEVLDAMACAQHEISNLTVKVGIGIHFGEFLDIGGGLFGEDADFIETMTEEHTHGGDIYITEQARLRLAESHSSLLTPITDLPFSHPVYSCDKTYLPSVAKSTDTYYPIPFPRDFYDGIRSSKERALEVFKQYAKERIVVLVKIHHSHNPLLLNTLTNWILANTIMQQLTLADALEEVKSNGTLGIYITDNREQAIQFAQDTRDTLSTNGYMSSIGISQGEILLFPMEKGKEIAGGPVNIASKLAEDSGEKNTILIHDSLDIKGLPLGNTQPFTTTISGVELRAIKM